MRHGLQLLQRPILELRSELQNLVNTNPIVEEITWDKERLMSSALPEEHVSGSVSERELDFDTSHVEGVETLNTDDAQRDECLRNLENFEPSPENGSYDPDAADRRQLMFDRQVKPETLQEHLAKQIPGSDIAEEDYKLAIDVLIDGINDDGIFTGSLPDIQMVYGKSEKELLHLLKTISTFEPLGCGGRNLRETLLYQMEKLDDSPWEDEVRELIDHHLDDLIAGRREKIAQALHLSLNELSKVIAELPKLSRKPGLGFSPKIEPEIYVTPEVFVQRTKSGKWLAKVPERFLPDIKLSKKYLKMLENPKLDKETKEYIEKKLEEAIKIRDSIAERQETIRKIAQSIIDVQYEVFEHKDMAKLKPLTQELVAKKVDVHNSTVSRTVEEKYMSTPLGVKSMRDFFCAGLKTENGEATISNVAVIKRIGQLVEQEDKRKPLSDQKIADLLKTENIIIARRTVAKYREQLHIPGTTERKQL